MKSLSQRLFTAVVVLFAGVAFPVSLPTSAHANQGGKTKTLADLPADARTAIADALEREGALAPDVFKQKARLLASDPPAEGVFLGISVAISGDTVVAGASGAKIGTINQGAAYIFVKPPGGWSNGVENAKLIASDGAASDQFGFSVSISGDTVVVGALRADIGSNPDQGAAYVFLKPTGGWSGLLTESAKLAASDGGSGNLFGASVAIAGETAVVGAAGKAYIFLEPTGGWMAAISESASLVPSDGGTFTASVALENDTVVVGVSSAYIFIEPTGGWSGTLVEDAKLSASDGEELSTVAISGDTVVAGAPGATVGTNRLQGSAYVFVEPPGGWMGTIAESAKLTDSNGRVIDLFATSVAIEGDTILAGVPIDPNEGDGSFARVDVFVKPAGGWAGSLTESESLFDPGNGHSDLFGNSVALEGGTLVGGTPGFGDQVFVDRDKGAVFIYEESGGGGDVSFVMDYRYNFDTGESRTGTDTLFSDGKFSDSSGGEGIWALLPGGQKLRLQYKLGLDDRLIGYFRSEAIVKGKLRSTDDPNEKGHWTGKITNQGARPLPHIPLGDASLLRE